MFEFNLFRGFKCFLNEVKMFKGRGELFSYFYEIIFGLNYIWNIYLVINYW